MTIELVFLMEAEINRMKKLVIMVTMGLICTSLSYAGSKVSINVSVTIKPILEISAVGPNNGHIEFGSVQKNAASPVTVESGDVVVTARSNLGEPYHVTQELTSLLSDQSGNTMQDQSLKSFAKSDSNPEGAIQGGAVNTKPALLYRSNPTGGSETIRARYELTVLPDQPAGNYESKLVYSIIPS